MLISGIDFLRNKTFKEQFEEYQQLKQQYEDYDRDYDDKKKAFLENRQLNDRVAKLGSKLYFILYEMSKISHMYQFSIMNFMNLFKGELGVFYENQEYIKSFDTPDKKIDTLNKKLRFSFYCWTETALTANHKLLLALILTVRTTGIL